ncbi:MAG: DNA translocase FtsK [Bacteroidales bacterium]|nr:DNA translocase FtsK [Bacteroidales bacterium]
MQRLASEQNGGSSKKNSRKSTSSKNNSSKTKTSSFSFWKFISGDKMIIFYGVLLILFALLLFLSIGSFYFNAHNNVAFVESDHAEPALNIAKGVGATLSYFFVQFFFGVISIGFPFLILLYGIRLVAKKSVLPLGRTTFAVLMTMAWVSITLGLVGYNSNSSPFLAGYFGNFICQFLVEHVGMVFSVLIDIAVLVLVLVFCYEMNIQGIAEGFQQMAVNARERKTARRAEKVRQAIPVTHTQHEDQPDLYITDHGSLSDEYKPKVYDLVDNKEEEQQEEMEKANDVFEPDQLFEEEEAEGQTDDIPFDFVNTNDKVSDELNDESGDELGVESDDEESEEEQTHELTPEEVRELEPFDPTKELSHFEFPPVDLLKDYPFTSSTEELIKKELMENKVSIEKTLLSFGIAIKSISAVVGPTVTLYEIVPKEGVRISKIKNLEDDIALSLSALGIRIIAPIPGRGTIGIEVPNKNPNIVSMREIINSDKFRKNNYALPIGLGKTINNESFVVDLAKMPHLLVAGATGQGKSVGLNAIITSLLYTKHPCEMKFVLVDPKKVEFTLYSVIENYYLATLPDNGDAIITDTKKVVRTLNSLCVEMDTRYDLLKAAKMRNIKEYNAKFCARELSPVAGHRYMPYIVVVIDEFGDLIMTAGREVEQPLARLAQLARAIGIHLVIATQRPSVNIITGSIKANFPARIAFRVQSGVDSKTILDATGANQLIGKGDMLISTGSDVVRLQCAFVDTPEVEKIAEFIEKQEELHPLLEPYELPDVPEPGDEGGGRNDGPANPNELDPMLVEAATLIVQTQQGSTSSIQRKLSLGYNRAGRIMDQLEDLKIVGPGSGSKPRQVLIKTEAELRQHLADLQLL